MIALGWVIAYTINVLRAANNLRTRAGIPDCEYGIEVEVRNSPPNGTMKLMGWAERTSFDNMVGYGLHQLPLLLPRLSFGPFVELDQIISLVVNDLCDAAAAHHPRPLVLNVVS